MIKVRHQVFVSSTYEDLKDERAEVMQALLELGCMPAGMELFPAASEEQWSWITRVIDESDYYIVIIGGKYGSVHPVTGTSYTEMEYQYAIESGKPSLGFVIDKSINLPENKIEIDVERREKLSSFKMLVQTKLCKFWTNADNLGSVVSRSITQLREHVPASGWIKADQVNLNASEEILALKNHVLELEKTLEKFNRAGQEDGEDIARGDDNVALVFDVYELWPVGLTTTVPRRKGQVTIVTTWNAVAAFIAPLLLMGEAPELVRRRIGSAYAADVIAEGLAGGLSIDKKNRTELSESSFLQIPLQFVALGYIENVDDQRWLLTESERVYFGRQAAAKREPPNLRKGTS